MTSPHLIAEVPPLQKNLIYVTGLPRAGSTLLCQLLGTHPDVYSPGHSSPLCSALVGMRHQLSDNDFLLSQLDIDPDRIHQRLLASFRGFVDGWFRETEKAWVVDKSRGWLQHFHTALALDPHCKMLVCIREPGQILGSVESRHRKTIMLDFQDHMAALTPYARADKLMGAEGLVGGPLKAMEAMQDNPEEEQSRLFYVVFEHLVSNPKEVMAGIYQWLGLPVPDVDYSSLPVHPHESDSYYRGKYPHATRSSVRPPDPHAVPARIQKQLFTQFPWVYDTFYPGMAKR
jgi:sulfotransferase